MLNDFAKRLKEIRVSMNMTMSEFSDLGDVGATTQGTYERENEEERRYPDVKYLLNLKSHGIDIHYLLTGEKSPENVISTEAIEIIRAYESADDNHKAIFEATAKACAVKPKGRVDKKKDDQDPPKGGSSQSIGDINTGGGSIGSINQENNNFSSNPKMRALKFFGGIFILAIVALSVYLSVDFNRFLVMTPSEQSLACIILGFIGFLLYKLGMFPICYEIELWYHKRK